MYRVEVNNEWLTLSPCPPLRCIVVDETFRLVYVVYCFTLLKFADIYCSFVKYSAEFKASETLTASFKSDVENKKRTCGERRMMLRPSYRYGTECLTMNNLINNIFEHNLLAKALPDGSLEREEHILIEVVREGWWNVVRHK